jgi:hypothetical protein
MRDITLACLNRGEDTLVVQRMTAVLLDVSVTRVTVQCKTNFKLSLN